MDVLFVDNSVLQSAISVIVLLHHSWLLHVDSFWVRNHGATRSSAVATVMVSIELKVARVGILQVLELDEQNVQYEAKTNTSTGPP